LTSIATGAGLPASESIILASPLRNGVRVLPHGQPGTVAMQQRRTILSQFTIWIMGEPEAYVQLKPGIIEESYRVTDERQR
jgi:hypothetical protein